MILDNKILWSNDMTLAICLITELDEDEFIEHAKESHLDLTGDPLPLDECEISEDEVTRRLELI